MRDKWVILGKNAHWWRRSKEVKKWVIQKGDDFWIVNGSEFPEKKITKKQMDTSSHRKGQRSAPFTIKFGLLVFLSSCLGVLAAALLARYVFLN